MARSHVHGRSARGAVLVAAAWLSLAATGRAILAGGELDLPADSPSARLDSLGAASAFHFVGALEVVLGTGRYIGSASALSAHWALSAGHNLDLNDDGLPDPGVSIALHLPDYGAFQPAQVVLHPQFTGFGNPSLHHDLSLLYFADPLPASLAFPTLGLAMQPLERVALAGFGRSGYGSYGYTSAASLTDRRTGWNIIDTLSPQSGGDGLLFRYDFDDPSTAGSPHGSLGNHLETLIGPGDSGGPVLRDAPTGRFALLGVNTFTEGYGGRFGDFGGGVSLAPSWNWVAAVTGLPMVPEPASATLLALGWFVLLRLRSARPAQRGR